MEPATVADQTTQRRAPILLRLICPFVWAGILCFSLIEFLGQQSDYGEGQVASIVVMLLAIFVTVKLRLLRAMLIGLPVVCALGATVIAVANYVVFDAGSITTRDVARWARQELHAGATTGSVSRFIRRHNGVVPPYAFDPKRKQPAADAEIVFLQPGVNPWCRPNISFQAHFDARGRMTTYTIGEEPALCM